MKKLLRLFCFLLMPLLLMACDVKELKMEKQVEQIKKENSIHGVDVSSYQGDIDWEELAENDIQFAFIKATEGSTYIDKCFDKNIEGAKKTDLAIGAYHFLSFDSDGKSQAENFISKVEPDMIDLPPVIDLEFYGKYVDNPPDFSVVEEILTELISELTKKYGRKPIIYTNRHTYYLYVVGVFDDCDIWMCDLMGQPELPGDEEWVFWQYSHTEKLSGYSGGEEHIDMNVFNGSKEEFEAYLKK
ncbi:MAG: glycosyl hydrolase family 25 [Oscillospiraceae bacterium]|nr:glycosyl hydrolase family 25 [Oscillospiraceae bacterium]